MARPVLLVVALTAIPGVAAPNGVNPPAIGSAVDVSCATAGGERVLRNARVVGLEPGRLFGEIRIRGAEGRAPVAVPLRSVSTLAIGRVHGQYALATLRRTGSSIAQAVQLVVASPAGPVEIAAYAREERVPLAACTDLRVTPHRPGTGPSRTSSRPATAD